MYEKEKSLLSLKGFRTFEDLMSGDMDKIKFHSKKAYAKKVGNLLTLIDLVCAWELFKMHKGR